MMLQPGAQAREGEANAEVVDYMAELLGVRRAAVALVSGGKCRDKVVSVAGMSREEALLRLCSGEAS